MVLEMVKDNKEFRPLLLKLGIALALSFAGFIYSQLRSKKMPSLIPQPSTGSNKIKLGTNMGFESGLRFIQATHSCGIASLIQPEIYERTSHENVINIVRVSQSNEHSEDEERLIFPEFDEQVKDIDFSSTNTDVEMPMSLKRLPEKETNQEIINLRNTVQVLREREVKLEVELLDYYGLKEQEAAVMELENRLRINNMEAKLFTLKIESLQADRRRMEAQVADYSKLVVKLESAKAKIKLLRRKIKSNAEQNKERISVLQQKVKALQDQEHKNAGNNVDIELKLQRLKQLEEESAELRRANLLLQSENSELVSRLHSTQILASSVLEVSQDDAIQEANDKLRLENENLTKEIEELQANRCADVEELVYLRWVNACLRYELRNQHVPPGKTVARDLSKTLSPRSEEKAKQLILEYASLEELGDKGISLMDIDSDYWSSSRNSNFTESSEFDDCLGEHTSSTRTNSSTRLRFYSKLKGLVRKKDSSSNGSPRKRDSPSTSSLEDMSTPCATPTNRMNGQEGKTNVETSKNTTPSQSSRKSFDIPRPKISSLDDVRSMESDKSDIGSMKRTGSRERDEDTSLSSDKDAKEKLKLMKFAEALRESNGSSQSPRKWKSFSGY